VIVVVGYKGGYCFWSERHGWLDACQMSHAFAAIVVCNSGGCMCVIFPLWLRDLWGSKRWGEICVYWIEKNIGLTEVFLVWLEREIDR